MSTMSGWLQVLAQVPDPDPAPPPGLGEFGGTLVSWVKYGGMIAGVVGLIICGTQMSIGRLRRSQMAVDGATGVPWVAVGLVVIGGAATFVEFFV